MRLDSSVSIEKPVSKSRQTCFPHILTISSLLLNQTASQPLGQSVSQSIGKVRKSKPAEQYLRTALKNAVIDIPLSTHTREQKILYPDNEQVR